MKLNIIYEGNPVLRNISKHVEQITGISRKLIDDMFETMRDSNGIGLAAPQVGINQRIIIVDIQDDKIKPFALIHPEIISSEGEVLYEEGCLSCPGLTGIVKRNSTVTVVGHDENGNSIQIEAEQLLAVVLQHEIDHLDGILFIDRLDVKEQKKIDKQRAAFKM